MNSESIDLFTRLGYPAKWIAEAGTYTSDDAYVAYEPQWAEPVPDIPEATVDRIIREHAAATPDAAAMIYLDRTISYGEFDDMVGRAAAVLSSRGVSRGDVVAVMVPTSAIHWVLFFAIARLGATHCGINVMYVPDEIDLILEDARPQTLISLDHFLPTIEQTSDALRPKSILSVSIRDLADPDFVPYVSLAPWWAEAGAPAGTYADLLTEMASATAVRESAEVDARTEAGQIVYTAGTTGRSKGVLQSHFNLMHNAITHTLAMPTVGLPVTYSALPLFHTGGFFVYSLPTFVLGGTVVPRPLFHPTDALAAVERHAINVFFGPPTLYAALFAHGLEGFDLSTLQVCATGAAPIPPALADKWAAATGCVLAGGFGMSELNSMGMFNGLAGRPTPGALGLPVVGEARIVLDDRVAARGEDGELEFRGLQVSLGYLGKPEATAEVFRDNGWFRTGDICNVDADGAIHYVDRAKDLILASGYNISPAEIERVLIEHPRIVDASVTGAPHSYRGEVPVAFVVGDATPDEIEEHCRAHLSTNKIPHRIVVLEQLPKNTMGKTLKRDLPKVEVE